MLILPDVVQDCMQCVIYSIVVWSQHFSAQLTLYRLDRPFQLTAVMMITDRSEDLLYSQILPIFFCRCFFTSSALVRASGLWSPVHSYFRFEELDNVFFAWVFLVSSREGNFEYLRMATNMKILFPFSSIKGPEKSNCNSSLGKKTVQVFGLSGGK